MDNQAVRDLILSHVKKHAEEVARPDLCFTPHEMDYALSNCSAEFQAQLTRQREEGQAAFDTWTSQINPTSYDNEYRDLLGNLAPGTGRWILRDPVYISWLRSQGISNSILWLCGIPGAGMSISECCLILLIFVRQVSPGSQSCSKPEERWSQCPLYIP